MNVSSPSVKSLLWREFEGRTGGFVDQVGWSKQEVEGEDYAVETTYDDEFKTEQDSLRVLMIKHAITSKSKVLARNVLLPYFNNTSNRALGKEIGLEFINAAAKDKTNPSDIRNRCFNIAADLDKDSNYIYSFVNDPSIQVSKSAIGRIWKWDELQKRMVQGLKNPEIDIAKRWFIQCLYVNKAGSENFDYYTILKQHPFFNEVNTIDLTHQIFEYSNSLDAFAMDLIRQGNSAAIKTAISTLGSRIERLGFNAKDGVEEEVKGLRKVKELLEKKLNG